MQIRAVQHADELAAERDQLQVSVDGLRLEMMHVQEQLVEQQASSAVARLSLHICCVTKAGPEAWYWSSFKFSSLPACNACAATLKDSPTLWHALLTKS